MQWWDWELRHIAECLKLLLSEGIDELYTYYVENVEAKPLYPPPRTIRYRSSKWLTPFAHPSCVLKRLVPLLRTSLEGVGRSPPFKPAVRGRARDRGHIARATVRLRFRNSAPLVLRRLCWEWCQRYQTTRRLRLVTSVAVKTGSAAHPFVRRPL
jgi:hypothetical protein